MIGHSDAPKCQWELPQPTRQEIIPRWSQKKSPLALSRATVSLAFLAIGLLN
jgi:hypothetical protein